MELNSPQYKLRCQLLGHQDHVRGLCVCGDSGIASASRDKSVCYWSAEKGGYVLKKRLAGHTSFVGTVAWLPPNEDLPSGGLVSGGMDTRVLVWDLETASVSRELCGHEQQVTSVAIDSKGDVLSSSVDSNVLRWRKGVAVEVLEGHSEPVQAVLALPSGEVVTGSSDTTIKVWCGSTCVRTLLGHTDIVRGLAFDPNVGIVSASHDCSVRLWATTGEVLREMAGHSAMVYAVAALSTGEIASGSEDSSAKIWRDGVCHQSIEHPGCVWDVKYLPNGDLVTACSDGIARVWTLDDSCSVSFAEVVAPDQPPCSRKAESRTYGGAKSGDFSGVDSIQHAVKSFILSPHPSWNRRMSDSRHIGLEDLEGDEEMRPEFSCPYCYDDFDITTLCAHLEDEHCFEAKAAVGHQMCPVCDAKVGKDMIGHMTAQHGHLLKHMHRRRRFKKAGAPSSSTLSLLGKELRDAHLHALLGGGSSLAGSHISATADPLLLSLVYNLPIPDAEGTLKTSAPVEETTARNPAVPAQQQKPSAETPLTTEERQHRWQQSQLRSKFVQQLMLSTLLKDS